MKKKRPKRREDDNFRNLDFDYDDILLAPFVRYHYAKQAEEDLNGMENSAPELPPEEQARVEKQIERYIRRQEWVRSGRKAFRALQSAAVFLVILMFIFAAVTLQVEPVREGVIHWLQDTGTTYTSLTVSLTHGTGSPEEQGRLGDISWKLDAETGTLTFSGEGELGAEYAAQCRKYENQVQTIVIGDGITSVGLLMENVGTLRLGKDVQAVQQRALSQYEVSAENGTFAGYDGALYSKNLDKLYAVPESRTEISYPLELCTIGSGAYKNSELPAVIVPWGVTALEDEAFAALEHPVVVLPDTVTEVSSLSSMYEGTIYLFSEENAAVAAVYDQPMEREFLGQEESGDLLRAWKKLGYRSIADICKGIDSAPVTGWQTVSGVRYYFLDNGSLATGWTQIGGEWYYFHGNHTPASGMTEITAKEGNISVTHTYCFDENGLRQTGLRYIDGKAYYFDADGVRLDSQWIESDGDWYYLGSGGAGVVSTWRLKAGKYRYLKADGKMAADEWVQDYDKRYYVDENGLKYTGTRTIGGKTYVFDADGVLQADAAETDSGKNGFVTENGMTRYYEQGQMITGLQYIDGKAYIFDDQGIRQQSGWRTYGGDSYYLNDAGAAVVSCWRLGEDGRYRYLGADGRMVYNSWVDDYGYRYYVDEEGARYESRWLIRDGARYWFGGSGKMAANTWLEFRTGKRYYFYADGKMAADTRVQTDGKWYYVRENGVMVRDEWVKLEDDWYYFGSDGAMLTDTTTPDGYRVDLQGRRK